MVRERALQAGGDRLWPVLLVLGPTLVVLGALIWYGLALFQPPPQKVIVFSTGSESGAYHAFGQRYRDILNRSGVKVELRPSRGSIENLGRLLEPSGDVSVAILQGGTAEAKKAPGLLSVGRIFYEPFWVFYRRDLPVQRITDLKGLRLAVGPEGSGTRKLALAILDANRIDATRATFSPLTGNEAADALLSGNIDAVFLTIAPESQIAQRLLKDERVKLLSQVQAEALTRVYPYLSRVLLPRGVVDLEHDLPQEDVQLVAPVASLVVRDELHPALVMLLAQAAQELHGGAALLQKPGEFPQAFDPQFPLSPDAQRYYRSGPPFLQRYLPFWIANLVERLALLLVPLATLAVPLARGLPALYRWRMRRRLNYWYGRLTRLEARIRKGANSTVVAEQHDELARIREAVQRLKVPNTFAEPYYNLRSHIDFVAAKLGVSG